MLFNSAFFVFVFLPVSVAVFFFLNRLRRFGAGTAWLVLCSLLFYGWWNPAYLGLIVGSVAFNYFAGRVLHGAARGAARGAPAGRADALLAVGVGANLLLLGCFKYADFLIANANTLGAGLTPPGLALPLGISFFTFTQIAFLVDVRRGLASEYGVSNYFLFVTYFPHLIAGPILHHKEMMPQFADEGRRRFNAANFSKGFYIFVIGLLKKAAVADTFARWASAGYAHPEALTLIDAWGTTLSYTLQLYFDFSGYSDMAVGSSLMLNIELPINFNSPYKAVSIQDFWRRWHMTLSRWLRDYLYIPLGGNRHGETRLLLNLLATFLLGGLWHGAGWTFVIWGALHGAAACVHRLWERTGVVLTDRFAWFVTFLFVHLAWVFFRAPTLQDAFAVLRAMTGLNGIRVPAGVCSAIEAAAGRRAWLEGLAWQDFAVPADAVPWIAVFLLVAWKTPNSMELAGGRTVLGFRLTAGGAVAAGLLGAAALTAMLQSSGSEFIYFNF